MKHVFACAAVGFGAALVSIAMPASAAIIVTVTGGSNQGVVFNGAGVESPQGTGALNAPPIGTYSPNATGTSSINVVTGAAATPNSPPAAYSGANYLAVNRGASNNATLAFLFTRPIDLATESFTIEYAFWGSGGTGNAAGDSTHFGVVNGNVTTATLSTANVLTGWRYNSGSVSGTHFGQYTPAASDTVPTLPYNQNGWNTLLYTWAAGSTTGGTLTLNGQSATLTARTTNPPPLTVDRFFLNPGIASSTIWVDAVPEPSSLSLVGIAAALMLRRCRRRA
jgi:hypothetical protein